MDERLEKALEFSNYQRTLQIKINNLKLRLEHSLSCNYNNHIFNASTELIAFASVFNKEYVIKDVKDIPLVIKNPAEFLKLLKDTYVKAHKEYYEDFTALKKARNIKKLVE